MMDVTLKVHRMYDDVVMPSFETEWSSCFDLRAYLQPGDSVKYWDWFNYSGEYIIGDERKFELRPGDRALVPTGLIFDLDKGQSIRAHPRSGTALKTGIMLSNAEGVIDADYTKQTFLTLFNVSKRPFVVEHGSRPVQAELYYRGYNDIHFEDVGAPGQKTSRSGGFGSTGKS